MIWIYFIYYHVYYHLYYHVYTRMILVTDLLICCILHLMLHSSFKFHWTLFSDLELYYYETGTLSDNLTFQSLTFLSKLIQKRMDFKTAPNDYLINYTTFKNISSPQFSLASLIKWLSVRLRTKWLKDRVPLQ